MDKERLKKLLQEQNLGSEYMMIDPNDIDMTYAPGMDPKYFWDHHGNTKQDYAELMGKLDKVYDAMASGRKVDELMSWSNPDKELRDTTYSFFSKERAVTVERWEDGKIHFAGDGRHRIMMAQELNMLIPVRMTYDELAKSKDEVTNMAKREMNYDDVMEFTIALQNDPMFNGKGMHVEVMDPDWITVTDDDYLASRRPDKNGMTVAQYEGISQSVPNVCEAIRSGQHLEDLMKGDSEMAQAARSYFDPKNMIRADVYGGDEIRLDEHGVQQLLAAQKTNVPVPVYSIMQPEMHYDKPRTERRLPELPYEDPPFMKDEYISTRRLPEMPFDDRDEPSEPYRPDMEL